MVSQARMEAGRAARIERFNTRIRWLGDQLEQGLRMSVAQRLRLAAQLLRDKVVINISIPVVKERRRGEGGRFARTRVTQRSRPGEFPRADTTRLMKDIYYEVQDAETAIVGTTLDYGLILETRMDRAFLRRTLLEMQPELTRLLTSGLGGADLQIR